MRYNVIREQYIGPPRRGQRYKPTRPAYVGEYSWIRPRLPDGSWGPGWCQDKPVFLVAGGPSLIGVDLSVISPYTTITINRSHRICRSDVVAFLDKETARDIREHEGSLDFGPRIVASNFSLVQPGKNVTTLKIGSHLNITDPSQPVFGRKTSATLGLSVALLGGAKYVFMLGVDCRFIDGQHHCHPHPVNYTAKDEPKYLGMAKAFDVFEPVKDRIFNLSAVSAVTTFQKITLDEALEIARSV